MEPWIWTRVVLFTSLVWVGGATCLLARGEMKGSNTRVDNHFFFFFSLKGSKPSFTSLERSSSRVDRQLPLQLKGCTSRVFWQNVSFQLKWSNTWDDSDNRYSQLQGLTHGSIGLVLDQLKQSLTRELIGSCHFNWKECNSGDNDVCLFG